MKQRASSEVVTMKERLNTRMAVTLPVTTDRRALALLHTRSDYGGEKHIIPSPVQL